MNVVCRTSRHRPRDDLRLIWSSSARMDRMMAALPSITGVLEIVRISISIAKAVISSLEGRSLTDREKTTVIEDEICGLKPLRMMIAKRWSPTAMSWTVFLVVRPSAATVDGGRADRIRIDRASLSFAFISPQDGLSCLSTGEPSSCAPNASKSPQDLKYKIITLTHARKSTLSPLNLGTMIRYLLRDRFSLRQVIYAHSVPDGFRHHIDFGSFSWKQF
uniref:Uncharacterized protein n=1 Tax=Spongospora subterranea TaxID=70186 RepID=A0A0H5QTS4_9EUKA|eukprot:CRZ05137.1 hypothetical protein [Spongospora subterranea]